MLRNDAGWKSSSVAWILAALVGAGAATLVARGNPGNMGICGVCFLRDVAGSLGFTSGKGPAYFRPEVPGLILGAFVLVLARRRYEARSGSHSAARFVLGGWMAIGALAFLGCPSRMLQRLGGGDLNAWVALPGFVAGVGAALLLEGKGYSVGKTSPAPAPVGWLGPLAAAALLGLFLKGGILSGPGPGDSAKPLHAPWLVALGIALAAGAVLSATGLCTISAARQVFQRRKMMLVGAASLVAGYAVVAAATGRLRIGWTDQPIAHGDLLWSALGLALVGLAGALAGGCPVRQMIMAGEGNGDAFVTVSGMLAGGATAHTLGLVASPAAAGSPGGVPWAGKLAVLAGLVFSVLYGLAVIRFSRARADLPAPRTGTSPGGA